MKALSLLQPWASLIAFGEKKIETRSWKTSYRGELYIHSSAKFPLDCRDICRSYPFWQALEKRQINIGTTSRGLTIDLPTGVIIAKCNLIDCKRIISFENKHTFGGVATLEDGSEVRADETFYGDYTPGRYAWILEDIEKLQNPIPAKGKLSIWEF
jgi:hypothetical protein